MKCLSVLLALLPTSALAQDGVDAHELYLVPQRGDAHSGFTVRTPLQMDSGDWFAGAVFEFARDLLVLHRNYPDGTSEREVYLGDAGVVNLAAGVALHERIILEAAWHMVPFSTGVDGANGFALGDVRVGATVPLVLQKNGRGFGLSLSPWVDVPSGDEDLYLGRAGVAAGGEVTAGVRAGAFSASTSVGATFQPAVSQNNLNGSDQLRFGVGIGVAPIPKWGLRAEVVGLAPLEKNEVQWTGFPIEGRLLSRHTVAGGFTLVGGGAVGISSGVGASTWRVFLGASFGAPPGPSDPDEDGFLGEDDACPDQAEVVNGYRDDDGCPDELASVRVTAAHAGERMEGVEARITLGDETEELVLDSAGFERGELMPGTTVASEVRFGNCLEGALEGTLAEGVNDLVVDLQRREGLVAWKVVERDGTRVPDAVVTFEGAGHNPCVPPEAYQVTGGIGSQSVGTGDYTAFVTAPDHGSVTVPLKIVNATELPVRIVLDKNKVQVAEKAIEILEAVYFDFGSDLIQSRSHALLEELASTLGAHPEIRRVEVAGHTDSDGPDEANQDLSNRRAASVVRFLVERGVDPSRLTSVGYGESRPLVPNSSADNKAKNRRVEFAILERDTP